MTAPDDPAPSEADVVVVGAGVAGAIVAGRLAAAGVSVVVLESGRDLGDIPEVRSPVLAPGLWSGPAVWHDVTASQRGLGGRQLSILGGRAVGGSSVLNAALWIRGHPADYAAWEAFGAGWTSETAVAAFRDIEDAGRAAAPGRGTGGRMAIDDAPDHPWLPALLDAASELGLGRSDANGLDPAGVDRVELTVRNGRRGTFADAYLRPVLGRGCILVTDAHAVRLTFQDGRVTGVVYRSGDHTERHVAARREVVLAAGAVRTAHLLLLSGVGPADELRAVGIGPVVDSPGVGRNLRDHPCIPMGVYAKSGVDDPSVPADSPATRALWQATGTGPLAGSAGAVLFARSCPGLELPDIEIIAGTGVASPEGEVAGIRLGVIAVQPRSVGTVRLAGPDPVDPPLVDPGYLTDPEGDDLATLVAGVALGRRLLATASLSGIAGEPVDHELAAVTGNAAIERLVRERVVSTFHLAGTARFGADGDPLAVLDHALRVRGLAGVRVVDASAMPTLNRGHTMAPTAVIAERAAQLMLSGAAS